MQTRWAVLLGILSVVLLLAASSAAEAQEAQAERAAGHIKSWGELRQVYHRYPRSDDGIVAEIYSDFVVHTLATKWHTLGQLQALVGKDPDFGEFVFRHIDSTADTVELQSVLQHARRLGTRNTSGLRHRIASEARWALAH